MSYKIVYCYTIWRPVYMSVQVDIVAVYNKVDKLNKLEVGGSKRVLGIISRRLQKLIFMQSWIRYLLMRA